jgi:hypothetical protein
VGSSQQELPGAEEPGWFDRLPLSLANRADDQPRPFGSWATTSVLAASAFAVHSELDGPLDPRWRGGFLFDDSVRDAVRGSSPDTRDTAGDISDVLRGGLWAWLVADTAMIRGWGVQQEVWRINLDAALSQGLAQSTVKYVAGRERPDGSDNRSFFSGHASSAATAAGLICAHHLHGDLYGGGRADSAACAGAVAAALGAGVARIVADRHYTTDVLVGWGTGALFGYVLPSRWYYTPPNQDHQLTTTVVPTLGRDTVAITCSIHW